MAGVWLGRKPNRSPPPVIILGGVFVLIVGSMTLRGITTLAGGHVLERFHDLADFTEIAGLAFGMIVGMTVAVVFLRRIGGGHLGVL